MPKQETGTSSRVKRSRTDFSHLWSNAQSCPLPRPLGNFCSLGKAAYHEEPQGFIFLSHLLICNINKNRALIPCKARSDFEVFLCKIQNWRAFPVCYAPLFEGYPSLVKLVFKAPWSKNLTPHSQEYNDGCSIIFAPPCNGICVGQICFDSPCIIP